MVRGHEGLKRSEKQPETLRVVDVEAEREAGQGVAGPIPVATDGAGRSSELKSTPPPAPLPLTLDFIEAYCSRTSWTPDSKVMLFDGGLERSRAEEEFRALRSRLYQLREKQNLKTLLIASSLPGEGRSFVALNLAKVMALQSNCKVLLVDADLRNPRLHETLGASREPGLAEYGLDEVSEVEVAQKGSNDSLFFIPAGRSVAGPTELIANGRLKLMIERVEPLFDWIIIDSPPATAVSDACLLGNCCDGVLMVVRSNSTPFDIVRKAQEKFREEQIVGVVLNVIQVPPREKVTPL
jgi:capsular exopolysaccharide synthesis family protein